MTEPRGIELGIDRVCATPSLLPAGRIGLVTNYTGLTSDLRSNIDVLHDAGAPLTALFGPEHGIQGSAQAGAGEPDIESGPYGTAVYDTYQKSGAELDEMIRRSGVETLVFDIQDVGSRFYTYAWTMYDCLAGAARLGRQFVVLDRPNPIGGTVSEGPVAEAECFSFVGRAAIPIRHGLTMGELARHHARTEFPDLAPIVIEMTGWRPGHYFDRTGLPWVLPSPNMPTLDTAIAYPGTCLFEGININEGRGTTRPFELLGAPYFDERLSREFHRRGLPGVLLRDTRYIPTFGKYAGESLPAIQVHVTDRDSFRPIDAALHLIELAQQLYPDDFAW
ncbi:MAG: exo-beta-N-acetylmuramidase NamZ family protein, partial [Candidatus Limnocylindrales bacterium]